MTDTKQRLESGFSLIEALVALLITSVVSLMMVSEFLETGKRSYDHSLGSKVNEQTRTLLDYIAYDLRMLGAGMPLGQSGFAISDVALGNAPLPVLVTSNANTIVMRANEKGFYTVLTADFTPTVVNRSFTVFDSTDLSAGDIIYLSDMPTGGSSGLMGTIQTAAGSMITLQAGMVYKTGAVFKSGSSINRITTITYANSTDGITRNGLGGLNILQSHSTFTVDYLDAAGAAISLPLTEASIKNVLTSMRVNVTVTDPNIFSTGQTATSNASQVVSLRNLILMR